jgi:zinc transporter ZupT
VIVGIDAFVLPITAGGFIYISLVNIVPTLFEPLAQSARLQTVWEAAGMCVGAGLMMLVSVIEEQSHH